MKEIKELTAKELVLVEMLQKATREHPVTRQVLRQTFGNDRKCRDMIANIRKTGEIQETVEEMDNDGQVSFDV